MMNVFVETRFALVFALSSALGFTASATAQEISDGAMFYKRSGGSLASVSVLGKVKVYASAPKRLAQADAYGGLTVQFLGGSAPLGGSLKAVVSGSQSRPEAGFTGEVRFLGKTLVSRNYGFCMSQSLSIGPYSMSKGIRYRAWVGPVPVVVTGQVGLGGSATLGLRSVDLVNLRIKPYSVASVYGTGRAYAGLDLFIAGIGIGAKIDFGRFAITGSADVLPIRISGKVGAEITPVDLQLYLKAWLGFWIFKHTWYKTLFNWSAPSIDLGTKYLG